MPSMTFDVQALSVLLNGNHKTKIKKLSAAAGDICPRCDSQNIDDNDSYFDRTYLCNSCHHQWDAVMEEQ